MHTFRSNNFVAWCICFMKNLLQVKELTKDHRPDNEDEVTSEGFRDASSHSKKDDGSPNIIMK